MFEYSRYVQDFVDFMTAFWFMWIRILFSFNSFRKFLVFIPLPFYQTSIYGVLKYRYSLYIDILIFDATLICKYNSIVLFFILSFSTNQFRQKTAINEMKFEKRSEKRVACMFKSKIESFPNFIAFLLKLLPSSMYVINITIHETSVVAWKLSKHLHVCML